jgi:hypothetical protein
MQRPHEAGERWGAFLHLPKIRHVFDTNVLLLYVARPVDSSIYALVYSALCRAMYTVLCMP